MKKIEKNKRINTPCRKYKQRKLIIYIYILKPSEMLIDSGLIGGCIIFYTGNLVYFRKYLNLIC